MWSVRDKDRQTPRNRRTARQQKRKEAEVVCERQRQTDT